VRIDAALAHRLLRDQFPQWADLPIVEPEVQGIDNRTFRVGTDVSIRLPSAEGYVPQVEKEQTWLPILAPQLSLPIARPLAMGSATEYYPWPWSVRAWIEGSVASVGSILDLAGFARDLAGFLGELQRIDPAGGPIAGPHSFFRGGDLAVYDEETRATIAALGDRIDGRAALATWDAARSAAANTKPVWVHGDIAPGNLIVRDGRLAAVIDFGSSAVGDPACDLVIAWTFFSGPSRDAFRESMAGDDDLWARARGWALWKALIVFAADPLDDSAHRVIRDVTAET